MGGILFDQLTSVGGPILVILLIISVLATAVAIRKVIGLSRLGVGSRAGAEAAMRQWAAGDAVAAHQSATADRSALARVVAEAMAAVWQRPAEKERAREAATGVAIGLLDEMAAGVRILDTAVQAAPMLGLLGTVLGMIVSFNEMAVGGGAVDPAELAGGIWIALSTTALGLAIAIPFYFLTSWIDGRIERERSAMDAAILRVVFGAGPNFTPQAAATPYATQVGAPDLAAAQGTRPRW